MKKELVKIVVKDRMDKDEEVWVEREVMPPCKECGVGQRQMGSSRCKECSDKFKLSNK